MKVAALDLGTNTFLCLIVEGDASGIKTVLSDQSQVVRLGQGIAATGFFHPDALARAKQCLEKFKEEIDRRQVDRILAMATSAARDAHNKEELFKIGRDLNIPIEIIPGGDEARITFSGATEGLDVDQAVAVIDIGGGSTEFIVGQKNKLHFTQSLNVGCVRLTEKMISKQPIPPEERSAVEKLIDQELDKVIRPMLTKEVGEILAVAGTPTSLAASEIGHFDPEKVQGFILDQEKLRNWCDILASTSTQEKIDKYKLEPGRADVLFVGATLLYRFLVKMNKPSMKVSIKGVRYGVALEALSRNK